MKHPIEPHAGGKLSLAQPQQRWTGNGDGLSASARFAGHVVEIYADEDGAFDLLYLGFHAKGYDSMDDAQKAAPDFARRVLQWMRDLIAD